MTEEKTYVERVAEAARRRAEVSDIEKGRVAETEPDAYELEAAQAEVDADEAEAEADVEVETPGDDDAPGE